MILFEKSKSKSIFWNSAFRISRKKNEKCLRHKYFRCFWDKIGGTLNIMFKDLCQNKVYYHGQVLQWFVKRLIWEENKNLRNTRNFSCFHSIDLSVLKQLYECICVRKIRKYVISHTCCMKRIIPYKTGWTNTFIFFLLFIKLFTLFSYRYWQNKPGRISNLSRLRLSLFRFHN